MTRLRRVLAAALCLLATVLTAPALACIVIAKTIEPDDGD